MTRSHTRRQRGGYGYTLGLDQARIGGQTAVMRYSECPLTDKLSADYPTALYNSQGGSRRRSRNVRRTRRVRRSRNVRRTRRHH